MVDRADRVRLYMELAVKVLKSRQLAESWDSLSAIEQRAVIRYAMEYAKTGKLDGAVSRFMESPEFKLRVSLARVA